MRPSYTVIPSLDRNRIEAGETLEIDVYLSGYGSIERSKLYLQQPNLLDESSPGEWTVAVREGRLEGSVEAFEDSVDGVDFVADYLSRQDVDDVIPVTGESSLVTRELDPHANRANLVPAFFLDDPASVRSLRRLDDRRAGQTYPGIVAEGRHDGHPPIRIRLKTRPDVPSGDYTLRVVFTYGDDTEVYQDVQTVDVHVKTPSERLEPIPTLARIAAVGIAVTGLGWTVSPYVGTAIFGIIVAGAVWYRGAIRDLFEGPAGG